MYPGRGADLLLQDTADLWRVSVWMRPPFLRTEHSCCLDVRGQLIAEFGNQLRMLSLENSLPVDLQTTRQYEGDFVLLTTCSVILCRKINTSSASFRKNLENAERSEQVCRGHLPDP